MSAIDPAELDTKIELLETRLTFQEDTIEALNKVLIQQQQDIEHLKRLVEILQERVKQSLNLNSEIGAEEPPPHY